MTEAEELAAKIEIEEALEGLAMAFGEKREISPFNRSFALASRIKALNDLILKDLAHTSDPRLITMAKSQFEIGGMLLTKSVFDKPG